MDSDFDFIVIGGGSAGFAAARVARQFCNKVAIIDGATSLGGLCILRGCMPSKTLLYSAEILHLAQKAQLFGLSIPLSKPNTAAIQKRKKRIVEEFADYRKKQLESSNFSLFRSSAHFVDPETIQLDDGLILKGARFLLATGSVVSVPPSLGLEKVPYWTSDDILNLDEVPDSILVLGGGIVACELAQYLARMGTNVTMVQRSAHLLKNLSQSASLVLEKAFRDEGIQIFTDTQIESIESLDVAEYTNNIGSQFKRGAKIRVTFKHRGRLVIKEASALFNALGRNPNTSRLGLENTDIQVLPSGHIKTYAFQQTDHLHIYAAGDCAGPHEIVHVAILQGECAAHHAFGKPCRAVNYDHLLKIVFTDPQIATVGLSEDQLKERNIHYFSSEYPFDDHGKSILMEARYGYVKVLAESKTGRVLGAECVGKDAGELIHALSVAISLNATVYDLIKTHWYHPTLSEIWTYPIEELVDRCWGQ